MGADIQYFLNHFLASSCLYPLSTAALSGARVTISVVLLAICLPSSKLLLTAHFRLFLALLDKDGALAGEVDR